MTNSRIRPVAKFFFDGDKKFFVKGVTYGPFKPDAEGNYLGQPEQVDSDLVLMRQARLNVVRIYHAPPRWFLDRCAAAGMRVLVTLPWEKHIEFLRERSTRKQIAEVVRAAVTSHAGHPAIFGYLVGNEISSTMARWLGTRRVIEFVEELIRMGRAIDPDALFSYATYPPTEYLLPQNADFCCFNVYLHNQHDFEGYLLRLQNLTGEHPLILGEFGMDTIRHSQEEQAEMLGWHVDSVIKCGLAGTIFFTWTDEWFTGGEEITDWAFGIVTRERKPKKAFDTLEEKLGRNDSTLPHRPLPRSPFVSVIVCSYNGGKTLAACLDSLGKLNYPEYEIILVDDGSTDDTAYIAAQFPQVRYIHQSNHGLSHARNTGAAAAKGEVLAYTDSDCMADVDWLYYLIGTLVSGDYAGVGGPNITPPAQNWIQACVAAAPGGPGFRAAVGSLRRWLRPAERGASPGAACATPATADRVRHPLAARRPLVCAAASGTASRATRVHAQVGPTAAAAAPRRALARDLADGGGLRLRPSAAGPLQGNGVPVARAGAGGAGQGGGG